MHHYVHLYFEVLSRFSAMLSEVDHLSITATGALLRSDADRYLDSAAACLVLLRLFNAAVTLDVSQDWERQVAHGLDDATEEMVADLMSSLRSLCLKGEPVASVARVVVLRRLSGRPVTISN